uniref:Uncharacterized protein n=1 Tax=Anopheles darlingi TaxID=43151 RepID=A0A2M4D7G8_ANODA
MMCDSSADWSWAVSVSWSVRSWAAASTLSIAPSMSKVEFGYCSMLTAMRISWFSSSLARSHSSRMFSRCSWLV